MDYELEALPEPASQPQPASPTSPVAPALVLDEPAAITPPKPARAAHAVEDDLHFAYQKHRRQADEEARLEMLVRRSRIMRRVRVILDAAIAPLASLR